MAQKLRRLPLLLSLALPRLPALVSRNAAARGPALAALFEGMGGAWVKFGQFLAIRHDLLDPAIIAALSNLFDRVAPAPFPAIRAAIETELDAPLSRHFASVEEQPIAAGAIAQVHGGITRDGVRVAIKVRRPGIVARVAADIAIMRRAARLLALIGQDDSHLIASLIDEFAAMLYSELDLVAEAGAMAAIGAALPPGTRAPAILGPAATSGLLVMERVEGTPFTRLSHCPPGLPPLLADACLAQYFLHGRFHGDPHPGNLMLGQDGRIIFLDFGLAGTLSAKDMQAMARYVLALAAGRYRRALDELTACLAFAPNADAAAFRREAIPHLRRWRERSMDPTLPAAARSVGQFQMQLMAVMRRTGVRVDGRFTLYFRALSMLDATALGLPVPVDLPGLMQDFLMRHRAGLATHSLPRPRTPAPPVSRYCVPLTAARPAAVTRWPAALTAALAAGAALLAVAGAAGSRS